VLAEIDAAETDQGPASARRTPERLCVATRAVKPIGELMRFVVGPDGAIVPDLAGNLPGRGAWITATREALGAAIKSNAFGRAFRGKGKVPPDLVAQVDRLLERALFESLSLAHKAGKVVFGFAKVEAALEAGRLIAVVQTTQAGQDGRAKLEAAATRTERAGNPRPTWVRGLDGEQLDLALGRSNVVHAGLIAHPASRGVLARWLRLERWRAGTSGSEAANKSRGAGKSNLESE
jgi:predicted RNA-binding protein YlxR (DUF448 family)